MSAEGNLQNPFIFAGLSPTAWEVSDEYLDLAEQYPCPKSYIRGHLFKIFHHVLSLKSNEHQRQHLATAFTFEAFRKVVDYIREKYRPFHEGEAVWDGEPTENDVPDYNLKLPPWICQPYYRMPPEEHKQKLEVKQKEAEQRVKAKYFDKEGNAISRKHMKKLKRLEKRVKIKIERHDELCTRIDCANTRGLKCDYNQCRICCRKKCLDDTLNCSGHKLFVKNKKERAELLGGVKMKTNDEKENVMDVE